MNRYRVVAAIHDVAPKWEKEVDAIYTALSEAAPQVRPALLVVPNFHGKSPLKAHPAFNAKLRQWAADGSEVVLHGFTHVEDAPISPVKQPLRWALSKLLTDAEGEFLNLDPAEIRKRLVAGRAVLQEALGVSPSGFVPPAWLRNRHLAGALDAEGFRFTEGHWFIYDLRGNRRLQVPAVTFSGRTKSRAAASARFADFLKHAPSIPSDIRVAVHPADWTDAVLREAVLALVRAVGKTHRFTPYREMLIP